MSDWYDFLERVWRSEKTDTACRSCGWCASFHEYEPEDFRYVPEKKCVEAPCVDDSTHRGIRIHLSDWENEQIAKRQ